MRHNVGSDGRNKIFLESAEDIVSVLVLGLPWPYLEILSTRILLGKTPFIRILSAVQPAKLQGFQRFTWMVRIRKPESQVLWMPSTSVSQPRETSAWEMKILAGEWNVCSRPSHPSETPVVCLCQWYQKVCCIRPSSDHMQPCQPEYFWCTLETWQLWRMCMCNFRR